MISMSLAALAAFNLICTGGTDTSRVSSKQHETYNRTYRIDLDAMRYCADDCTGRQGTIVHVDPANITLFESEVDGATRSATTLDELDRRTGRETVTETYEDPRDPVTAYTRVTTATCARAPFSGFPTFDVKF